MYHHLDQLLNLTEIKALFESYNRLSGITCMLLDAAENILVAVDVPEICTQFHRADSVSAKRCQESNAALTQSAKFTTGSAEEYLELRCSNGMINMAMPITVGEVHIGTFVTGKFFYEDEPPAKDLFLAQADEFGFDHSGYLTALDHVPLLSRNYARKNMQFLKDLIEILAGAALANIQLFKKKEELQNELRVRKKIEEELDIQAHLLEEEITERKKIHKSLHLAKEQAKAANQAKSLFLANINHELRTPLNGIIGMAQLLEMTEMSKEQDEYLESLRLSADTLHALINDILEITRIEAEQTRITNVTFSLSNCLKDVVSTQQKLIAEKNLIFAQKISTAIPEKLVGDPSIIKLILSHLLKNAIKFTDRGSINIEVSIKKQDNSVLWLDILVSDTGIGIEQEKLSYIFDLFTQADESFTRRHYGAGLGLPISQKLAKLVGGYITVESEINKGSSFHLFLPYMPES